MARRRTKGTGEVYQEPGGSWAFRWREAGRRKYRGGFISKQLAEKARAVKFAEIAVRRAGLPVAAAEVPPLRDLAMPWLERRKVTHAAGAEDGYRWTRHLEPFFGHLRPHEVDHAKIRTFVETTRRTTRQAPGTRAPRDGKLAPGTLRVCVAVLSQLFEDLLERGVADRNPARHLPQSILRLLRSDHDPTTTPFVEKLEDVRRIFLHLDRPLNVAYAIGALAGLRTGEVFALRWSSVDLEARRMLVSESVKGGTKDKDPRPVPILDDLLPVLKAWKVESGGRGLVIPPLRADGEHVDKRTPAERVRAALVKLELPPLEPKPWYQATRHTFASHWAMAGGSLRELQGILGHASITETERYAHLAPGYFSDGARATVRVDLTTSAAPVARIGQSSASGARKDRATTRKK